MGLWTGSNEKPGAVTPGLEDKEKTVNNLEIFEFQYNNVRVVTVEGEPWFVLADLCDVLELGNTSMVAARVDDLNISTTEVENSRGQMRSTLVTNEPGMYEVIFMSRKPEAKQFKRWITSVVLPEIRKTGSYSTQPAIPQGQELLALAVVEAQQLLAAKDEQIAELEPKGDYVDTFVADSDLRLLRNVAKSVGVSESELRASLLDRKWIYVEKASRWSEREQQVVDVKRYSAYSHKAQYFSPVPSHEAPRFRGEVMHTLKVTPQGALAIARMHGVKELVDA